MDCFILIAIFLISLSKGTTIQSLITQFICRNLQKFTVSFRNYFQRIDHSTFFTNNLPELMANTTSLNPIARAANPGFRKPNAAMGIATIL